MLKARHHQQQSQPPHQAVALKEEAARVVVRDAIQRGHNCVELRRDGKRPIFFCVLCQTRCYNDASLWDHLKGNLHSRHLAGYGFPKVEKQDTSLVRTTLKSPKKEHAPMEVDFTRRGSPRACVLPLVVLPELRLKLADQGQMFVKVRPCSSPQFVEACWLEKRVLVKQRAGEAEYGVLVFPYSEGLGRGSPVVKNEKLNEDMQVVALPEEKAVVKKSSGRGRKRTKQAERICFICRQKMVPGKDVATLLNMNNKQMMCHSRNWLGAFHVYHTACLVNWILIFDAKFWMGHSLHFSRNYRKNLVSAGQNTNLQEKPIFCPECQGTGFRFRDGNLEPPRFRLAQIFDWVLELVQARKVWMDHLGQEMTGLMFHASKGICHPREFESSLVVPRGTLRFFYTELDSKLDGMKADNDGTVSMELDF